MDIGLSIDRSQKVAAHIAAAGDWPAKRIAEIQRYITRYDSDLRKLHTLSQHGLIYKTQSLRQRVVLGFPGNAVALLTKIEHEARRTGKFPTISWAEFERLANDLPSRSGKPDLNNIWVEKKAKGGYRLICDPGENLRTTHVLLCQVLDVSEPVAPHEYNLKGRGVAAAIEHICQCILAGDRPPPSGPR